MQWHTLPADARAAGSDVFQKQALKRLTSISVRSARYRSSLFQPHLGGWIFAGYYAYLWTQMLADDAYQWFERTGGLTRANGDRLRRMVLSRGNTEDLAEMYAAWRGRAPKVDAMLKDRGLAD